MLATHAQLNAPSHSWRRAFRQRHPRGVLLVDAGAEAGADQRDAAERRALGRPEARRVGQDWFRSRC